MKNKIKEGNIISELSKGETNSVEFGGTVQIGEAIVNPREFNDHYKKHESLELKQHYRDECNKARILNGLPPI